MVYNINNVFFYFKIFHAYLYMSSLKTSKHTLDLSFLAKACTSLVLISNAYDSKVTHFKCYKILSY